MPHYSLSEKELRYLSDTDFLRTKAVIYRKTDQLLSATQRQLRHYMEGKALAFPTGIRRQGGKISRGENYRNLPYHVLDFPRKFTREDVFTLRTMVWWGHYLSVTLHLSGDSLTTYRPGLEVGLPQLHAWGWQVCVGDDPWQYHREETNYRPSRQWSEETWRAWLVQRSFCKLSTFIPFSEWEQLPDKAVIFLDQVVQLLEL